LSFRGTSNVFEALSTQEFIERRPCKETCINWELKIGYHKLTRPKELSNDWIWIADHIVKAGSRKCLALVGVQLSTLQKRQNLILSLQDLEPLAIIPMQKSNSEQMGKVFESLIEVTGVPLEILTDGGSDLKGGVEIFQKQHSETVWAYDICHKVAASLKHMIGTEEAWTAFIKDCSDCKSRLQLTDMARHAPPNQRSKARYHNIDRLVYWGVGKIDALRNGAVKNRECLDWLLPYSDHLYEWQKILQVAGIARDVVRTKGYCLAASETLFDRLLSSSISGRSEEMACALTEFVENESEKAGNNGVILGSTEVIESMFGTFKEVVGSTHRAGTGFGRLILSMASRVGETSKDVIRKAFESSRMADIDVWLKNAYS
jgi:hypothetical protein